MKSCFFLVFFVSIFSFESDAFPNKKKSVIKNSASHYYLEEQLSKSGYLNSLISFCNYSSEEARSNKTYFKELKGFIGYVNWDLFKYFNSGVSEFNTKKDQGYGLVKRINWMYKIKGCDSQSIDVAIKDNLEIIQNEILPFIKNSTDSYSQTIAELKQKLLDDKKNDYSVFLNLLDLKENENTKQKTTKNNKKFVIKKDNSIYQGDLPLHQSTQEAGYLLSWLMCATGGYGDPIAQQIKEKVAQISWADYKMLNSAISQSTGNPPQFVGFPCNSGVNKFNETETRLENYLSELENKLPNRNQEKEDNQIGEADNSQTNNQLDLTETENLPQDKVENELIVSLEEAKQILILVQEFLPSNPTEFDIVALTKLIQKNKEVLQNSWSNEQQENFRELYDFLFQSDAFSNFKIAKDEETRKAKEEAIKQERVSLDQNISLLKDYLTQNMFADDAPQVLEMIAKGESLQSSDDIEELKTINEKISILLKKKDIEQLDIQKSNKNSNSDIKENIKNVFNIFVKEDDNNDQSNIEDNKTVELEKNNLVESSYVNFEDENVYGPCVFDICLYDKLETVIKNKKTSNCEYKNLEGVCEGLRCWKKDEIKKNLITRSYDGKWCEHGDSSMFSPRKVDLSLIFEMDDETNNILGSNFFEFQHALIINDETFSAFKKIKSYCGLPFRFQGRFVSNGGHSVIITALPDEKMEYFISDIFVQFNNFNEKVQTSNGHSEYQLKIFDSLIKRYETTFLNIRGQYDSYEDPDDYSRDDDALIIKDRLFQDNKTYNIRMWDGFDRNKLWGSPKHKMPAELLITNDIRYTTYNLPGDLTEVDLNAVMSSEEWNYLNSVYSKINQSEYCKELSEGPEVDLN